MRHRGLAEDVKRAAVHLKNTKDEYRVLVFGEHPKPANGDHLKTGQ
jgi:hypothetical protein